MGEGATHVGRPHLQLCEFLLWARAGRSGWTDAQAGLVKSHCAAEYKLRESQRNAYEDGEFFPGSAIIPTTASFQARKQYHRYDRNPTNPTMLRTRWGGRKNALEKGMMIHGKEVPDENGHLSHPELPGNRSSALIQDRLRPKPRVAYGDGKDQKPVPFGALRLAETPTMSRLISLREQMLDEQDRMRKAKTCACKFRRMYEDQKLTIFTTQAE